MDVKTLYAFLAVVDHGSFAGAAEALGVSLSSISTQMRGLEQETGKILFDRSRRPPSLTAVGYEFSEEAREVIRGWERLVGGSPVTAGGGVLKLGAVHTAVAGILPRALLRLRERMPEVSVRLTTGLTHELEAAVHSGRIDVAIVTEPDSVHPDAQFRPFCEERLVLIADSSAAGRTAREILAANSYVRFSRLARVARLVDAELRRLGVEVTSHMEVDSLDGVVSLVAAGLGVSIVPERVGSSGFPENVRSVALGPMAVRRLGLLTLVGNGRQRFTNGLFAALSEEARPEREEARGPAAAGA